MNTGKSKAKFFMDFYCAGRFSCKTEILSHCSFKSRADKKLYLWLNKTTLAKSEKKVKISFFAAKLRDLFFV